MEDIYYNLERVGSYGGVRPLANAANEKYKTAAEWLSGERAYSLHRPARRRMPKYRKYMAPFAGYQMQADLNEMHTDVGNRYILTCIDIFSRYAFAEPLKSKTGAEVTRAFKKIFRESTPMYLQVDQGTEFYNATFKQYLKSKHVHLFSVFSPVKASMVERYNRTLKTRMYRYFTKENTRKWVAILPRLVSSYNNTPHSSLPSKMTPTQAKEIENQWIIWEHSNPPVEVEKAKFNVGDAVRLSKVKKTFEKGYLTNWSEEIFYIHSINRRENPIMYVVKDYKGELVRGKFYTLELQKVKLPEKWPIEKIYQRRNGRVLVKFLGYPEKYWTSL